MTSLYAVSREDIYDYQRCPKIVAIKAYKAIRKVPEKISTQPRTVEPAIIGIIGEAAVKLGFEGVPKSAAIQQIARRIPQVDLNEYLKDIAIESLRGVEKIRSDLAKVYGEIAIIGKGKGRHPDLAGTVHPDFIAFPARSKKPLIVETKDSLRETPADKFQAMFYNGVADRFGVYLLEQRLERGAPAISPRLIQSTGETILVYPRLARYLIVKEKFAPSLEMIKEVWKAKELGFKGLVPESECANNCSHKRLKVDLSEGNMEPLPPPPLVFSEGLLESGHNLDIDYQANYAWRLLPSVAKLVILSSHQRGIGPLNEWKNWLVEVVGLDQEAADIVLDPDKREKFLRSKPDADTLLNSMKSELEPWEEVLKDRLKTNAPAILGRATSVYSLPMRSFGFVKDAWKRWQK